MKIFKRTAALLCLIAVLSCAFPAYAAESTDLTVLEQYAAELSQYTGLEYYQTNHMNRYIDYKYTYPDCTWETVITNVNIGLDHDYYSNTVTISQPDNLDVLVNKYRQLPGGFIPKNIETVSSKYSFQPIKLSHGARIAFEKMCADANALGFGLYATSGYRSYARQQNLYAEKPNDQLTARAGYSEHQTGLAVDVIHGPHRTNENLVYSGVYKWYSANAHKYGFIIRYPAGAGYQTGCAFEPWHLRYLGVELATAVSASGLTYDEYYVKEIDVKSAAQAAITTAVGVTSLTNIMVNGTAYALSAVHITGDTYYKLRDIAVIFNGSSLQFDVFWDSETKSIALLQGSPYTAEPTLGVFDAGQAANVTLSMGSLQLGDRAAGLTAYLMNGANFYKLDDILGLFGYAIPVNAQDTVGAEYDVVVDTATLLPIGSDPAEETAPGESQTP